MSPAPADERPLVAVIYDSAGDVFDYAFTWETGENYANAGYRVEALCDDGWVTKERAQVAYDSLRAAFQDCFGRTEPFPET